MGILDFIEKYAVDIGDNTRVSGLVKHLKAYHAESAYDGKVDDNYRNGFVLYLETAKRSCKKDVPIEQRYRESMTLYLDTVMKLASDKGIDLVCGTKANETTPAAIMADVKRCEQEAKTQPMAQQSDNAFKSMFVTRTANQCIEDAKMQPIPRDMYKSLMYEGEITILFADMGIGKSTFAVQIANEIAKTDKVLYFDLELSDKQFEGRYSDNYQNHFVFENNFNRVSYGRPVKIPEGKDYDTYFMDSLIHEIKNTGAKIVIIDNMTKIINSDTDKSRAAKPLMDKLTDLKFEQGLTMLLLEHTRKTDADNPIHANDMQGSKMKANFTDAAFSIGRSAKDKHLRYVKQAKTRSTETIYHSENVIVYELIKESSILRFNFIGFDTEANHLKKVSEAYREEQKEKAMELISQGVSKREIARQLDVSEGTIRYWQKQTKK